MAKKKKSVKRKATKKLRPGRLKTNAAGLTVIQVQFLDALRELHEIRAAAAATGVSRAMTYKWKKKPDYLKAYEEAIHEAEQNRKDDVRREIHEAAFDGWEEQIMEQEQALRQVVAEDGSVSEQMTVVRQKVRKTKKRSMSALLWEGNLLWGNPARVEVTGKDGGPIDARVSVEAFRQLAGL